MTLISVIRLRTYALDGCVPRREPAALVGRPSSMIRARSAHPLRRSSAKLEKGRMREPTGPHDLVSRAQLQHLLDDRYLALCAQEREDFTKVEEDVGIYGSEVPGFARIRVAGVKEDDLGLWIRLDDRLHDRGRGQRECDVVISESCVELHCTYPTSVVRFTDVTAREGCVPGLPHFSDRSSTWFTT